MFGCRPGFALVGSAPACDGFAVFFDSKHFGKAGFDVSPPRYTKKIFKKKYRLELCEGDAIALGFSLRQSVSVSAFHESLSGDFFVESLTSAFDTEYR